MFLLLMFPLLANAMLATATWDPVEQEGATYTVYENGVVVTGCQEITVTSCAVDKQAGDEFYVTTVIDGIESQPSNVVVIPYAPGNFKVVVTVEVVQ